MNLPLALRVKNQQNRESISIKSVFTDQTQGLMVPAVVHAEKYPQPQPQHWWLRGNLLREAEAAAKVVWGQQNSAWREEVRKQPRGC